MKLSWTIRYTEPTTKWRRRIFKVSAMTFCLAVVLWMPSIGYEIWLESGFTNRLRPNPTIAQTIPYRWKGTTIYVTPAESEALRTIHLIEIIAGSIGAISLVAHFLSGDKHKPTAEL